MLLVIPYLLLCCCIIAEMPLSSGNLQPFHDIWTTLTGISGQYYAHSTNRQCMVFGIRAIITDFPKLREFSHLSPTVLCIVVYTLQKRLPLDLLPVEGAVCDQRIVHMTFTRIQMTSHISPDLRSLSLQRTFGL